MVKARFASALLAATLVLAPACSPEQKALWCKTAKTAHAVQSAVSVALPLLAPGLGAQWLNLSEAMNVAMAPLLSACADAAGPQLGAAVDASVNLLEWYRAHRAEVEAATPRLMTLRTSAEAINLAEATSLAEVNDVLAKLNAYRDKR